MEHLDCLDRFLADPMFFAGYRHRKVSGTSFLKSVAAEQRNVQMDGLNAR